jgi:Deltex C-terminal domain
MSMLAATSRMLQTQEDFHFAGKPTRVSLGYHYTSIENVPNICAHGLLSPKERTDKNIKPQKEHGEVFGKGIYTAANPRVYHGSYGSLGIVVLQLLGKNKDFEEQKDSVECDSVTVHRHQFGEIVVLSSSQQCVPVLGFDALHIHPVCTLSPGNLMLDKYHVALQTLVDDFFNADALPVKPVGTSPQYETLRYYKPSSLEGPPEKGPSRSQGRSALLHHQRLSQMPADCCNICLKQGDEAAPLVHLDGCQHAFHESCLAQFSPTACVACWRGLGYHGLVGKMPSGVMTVRRLVSRICSDYESTTSIQILYTIPRDVQETYHPNPGTMHNAVELVAFLPDTVQAHNLLARLKYAFRHGLTFHVTNKNTVVPSSIPHKRKREGGPEKDGFPDPDYFDRCNRQLDALCVPIASQCDLM